VGIQKNFIVLLLLNTALCADVITVNNTTCRDVHAAIYRQKNIPFMAQPDAQRVTPVQCIDAQKSAQFTRPDFSLGYDRELVFVEDPALLTDTLSSDSLNQYHAKNIGNLQGSTFYLGDNDGDIYGYTVLEWKAIQLPLQYTQQQLLNLVPAIANNPYKNQVAYVRYGNGLCDQEKAFLSNRANYVAKSLVQFTGNPLGVKIPTIALVCSGGGFRAMLYATGALKGINELQLLDAITYAVALSGSTWAVGTWISSGKSIEEFRDWLINTIGLSMKSCDEEDFAVISETLLTKYWAGQPLGFVDLYGACLANDLFDSFTTDRVQVHISDQSKLIADGSLPMPIYTSISAEDSADENLWYEFTPHEVGAQWLNAYVPTWAFGRKFKNATSVTFAPEQPMGTLLGTFGLAIGITVKRMFEEVDLQDTMKIGLLKKLVARILAGYGDDRPICAEYLNFVAGIKNTQFNTLPILKFVDAGINFNLPYPPISGQRAARKADIMIFVDASEGTIGSELQNVENYAHAHQLPFPAIDYSMVGKQAVSIFKSDTDPNVPVVIYIPCVVDHALLEAHKDDMKELYGILHDFDIEKCMDLVCNTFNFQYTCQDARKVTALGEFNMLMARDAIAQAVSLCGGKVAV
jgi:phospholipase A2